MIKKLIRGALTTYKGSDRILTGAITVLFIFSSVMVVSASMTTKSTINTESFLQMWTSLTKLGVVREAFKQAVIVAVSFVAYHIVSHFYTRKIVRKFVFWLGFAVICLLIIASTIGNHTVSNAWIRIGGISFQPSEFAKPTIVFMIAAYCCDKNNKKLTLLDLVLAPGLFALASAFIIAILQNDFGSAFCFLGVGCITFLMVNNDTLLKTQRILLALIAVAAVCFCLLLTPAILNYLYSKGHLVYQLARFKTVVDPSWDVYGYSRELINSLVAIMKGNWFGVGLGQSVLKYGYIASSYEDYIFAIIIEETGLIGLTVVIGCYGIILWRLFKYAFKVKRNFDKCVLVGTISYLFIHMFLNIGGISALIPLTGVPLLLVSAGGSSCISIMAMLGASQRIIADYRNDQQEMNSLTN